MSDPIYNAPQPKMPKTKKKAKSLQPNIAVAQMQVVKLSSTSLQEKCDLYQIDPAIEVLEVIKRTKDPAPVDGKERAKLQMRLAAAETMMQYLYAKKKKEVEKPKVQEAAALKATELQLLSDQDLLAITRERLKAITDADA